MECTDPNGCTLDAGELVTRISEWREVASHATSRKVEAGRITSIYPRDAALVSRLQELIAAEAECCTFLEFTIHAGADHTIVEVSFPPEARALIEGVMSGRASRTLG